MIEDMLVIVLVLYSRECLTKGHCWERAGSTSFITKTPMSDNRKMRYPLPMVREGGGHWCLAGNDAVRNAVDPTCGMICKIYTTERLATRYEE